MLRKERYDVVMELYQAHVQSILGTHWSSPMVSVVIGIVTIPALGLRDDSVHAHSMTFEH